MKKVVVYTFIVALAISAFACKSSSIVDPTANLRLKEQNYSLSGTTSGEYTAFRFLAFKPIFWNKGFTSSTPVYYGPFGPSVIDIAKEGALYDALGKLKNADMVTAPRYTVEHLDMLIFEKATVTVNCRGVELSK